MTLTELNKLEKKMLKRLETVSIAYSEHSSAQIAACAEVLSHINSVRYGACDSTLFIEEESDVDV